MSYRGNVWKAAGLALACALVGGAAGRAFAQASADDLGASIGAIATHTTTDANGARTTEVTISGSFGEASFVLDDQQTRALYGGDGNTRGAFSLDMSVLTPLYANHMKDTLGATDDEWKVLAPKIVKVRSLSLQISSHGRNGRTVLGRSELDKAWRALDALAKNKEAKTEEIKAAMQAVDAEEAKIRTELEQARKDLRQLLTLRQEALLVHLGILE